MLSAVDIVLRSTVYLLSPPVLAVAVAVAVEAVVTAIAVEASRVATVVRQTTAIMTRAETVVAVTLTVGIG